MMLDAIKTWLTEKAIVFEDVMLNETRYGVVVNKLLVQPMNHRPDSPQTETLWGVHPAGSPLSFEGLRVIDFAEPDAFAKLAKALNQEQA